MMIGDQSTVKVISAGEVGTDITSRIMAGREEHEDTFCSQLGDISVWMVKVRGT